MHTLGHIADSDDQAAEEFWPSYSHTFTRIGRERGWGPLTRAAFDAQRGPTGAFLLGSSESIAAKLRHIDHVLGGVSRVDINMSGGWMPHDNVMHAINLFGTVVKPLLDPVAA